MLGPDSKDKNAPNSYGSKPNALAPRKIAIRSSCGSIPRLGVVMVFKSLLPYPI